MGTIRIVDVRIASWWRRITSLTPWRDVEAILENEQGIRKSVLIIDSFPLFGSTKTYIEKKYCMGDQFWAPKKKKEIKPPKVDERVEKLRLLSGLVGETFDCVDVIAREEVTR